MYRFNLLQPFMFFHSKVLASLSHVHIHWPRSPQGSAVKVYSHSRWPECIPAPALVSKSHFQPSWSLQQGVLWPGMCKSLHLPGLLPGALAESPEAQEDTSSSLSFIKPDRATFEPEYFFSHLYKSWGNRFPSPHHGHLGWGHLPPLSCLVERIHTDPFSVLTHCSQGAEKAPGGCNLGVSAAGSAPEWASSPVPGSWCLW